MSDWKLPAIEGGHQGCLNCGPILEKFHPDSEIAVGFGYAALTKNGIPVYEEPFEGDDFMTGAQAEKLAAESGTDDDWRIILDGPLRGRTYQRHAPNEWVLIKKNQGFA